MKNIISFLCLMMFSTVGCKLHPDFQEVKLENGSPGFLVNCRILSEKECMAFSTDVCKDGGKLLHSNVNNMQGVLLISCQ